MELKKKTTTENGREVATIYIPFAMGNVNKLKDIKWQKQTRIKEKNVIVMSQLKGS